VNEVKGKDRTRTRRADKAERTRQAILQAASELFATQGFAATTIRAIAAEADVAAETIYPDSATHADIRDSETAIVGNAPRVDVLELPDLGNLAITDQRTQLARLAHLSRGTWNARRSHIILRNPGRGPAQAVRRRRPPTSPPAPDRHIAMLLDNGLSAKE
jgi:hypothetical protein